MSGEIRRVAVHGPGTMSPCLARQRCSADFAWVFTSRETAAATPRNGAAKLRKPTLYRGRETHTCMGEIERRMGFWQVLRVRTIRFDRKVFQSPFISDHDYFTLAISRVKGESIRVFSDFGDITLLDVNIATRPMPRLATPICPASKTRAHKREHREFR